MDWEVQFWPLAEREFDISVHSPARPFSILMRFRFHRVGVSADMAKMYRHLALGPEKSDFHSNLWRKLTSGASSAPPHDPGRLRHCLLCLPIHPVPH